MQDSAGKKSLKILLSKYSIQVILAAQDFLSMAFADSGESEDEDGKRVDITKTSKAREQFKLSKALAVMGVKASTFHALYVGGKKDRVNSFCTVKL